MNPKDHISQAQLAALIANFTKSPVPLWGAVYIYHSHPDANHLFYETEEDMPLDERHPKK